MHEFGSGMAVQNLENLVNVICSCPLRLLEFRTLWKLEVVVDITRAVQVALTLLSLSVSVRKARGRGPTHRLQTDMSGIHFGVATQI